MKKLLAAAVTAVFGLNVFAQAASAEKVTILLDWFINPDHGPLFVAEELGLFEAQGIEVELIEPADPSAPPRLVAAGQAELAISYQPQLHIQVSEGLPLVRVVLQYPCYVVVRQGTGNTPAIFLPPPIPSVC